MNDDLHTQVERLAKIARALLPRMVDQGTQLLSHKMLLKEGRLVNMGTNVRYTAIALVGLAADSGGVPDAFAPSINSLVEHAADSADASVLGAATWALALARDERMGWLSRLLDERIDAPRAASMGLGLAITGLAAAAEHGGIAASSARTTAQRYTVELTSRLSRGGYFAGSGRLFRRGRLLYGGSTSFASQVYPLHGLAAAVRVLDLEHPERALRVGRLLVDAQGSLGQWWWFYSTHSGRVLEGYPVYSVHQDAMAFMALLPLQELGHGSFAGPLSLGLRWLFGENELRSTLVDQDRGFIARCIQRRGSDSDGLGGLSAASRRRLVLASRGLARSAGIGAEPVELEILKECRSYHLGWILYARALLGRVVPHARVGSSAVSGSDRSI
jgi:hypothetical protein